MDYNATEAEKHFALLQTALSSFVMGTFANADALLKKYDEEYKKTIQENQSLKERLAKYEPGVKEDGKTQ